MDITWFSIGLGVGALAIYIWLRKKTHQMMQENSMIHSHQHTHNQTRPLEPPATMNYSPPNPSNSGSSHSKAEFDALEQMILTLQEAVESLQDDVREISSSIKGINPNLNQLNREQHNVKNRPSDKTKRSGTATVAHSPGLANAVAAYRKLSCEGLRDLPMEPLFVVLDIDSSARGSAIGETKRHFNQSESKQSAFVIFPEGEKEGWIFPNARISFTEAMKYVFPDLSYENFEEAKDRVEPQRVHSVSQGAWETVAT
jgi:hypothetical protein